MRDLRSILNEAVTLFHQGQLDKCEFILDMMLRRFPENPEIMGLLGTLYTKLGKHGAAIAMLSRSCEIAADDKKENPSFWVNLGTVLKKEEHFQLAEVAFQRAVELAPNYPMAYANYSGMYINAGNPQKAEELARKAIELASPKAQTIQLEGIYIEGEPEQDDESQTLAKHHLGLALMEQGKWEEAWPYHEARKKHTGWQRPVYDPPLWEGQDTGTLVIHGEQGIGDELMYCSLIPRILPRIKRLVIESTPRLCTLMRRTFGCEVFPNMEEITKAGIKPDHIIAMGSLPGVLKLSRMRAMCDFYLEPDMRRRDHWRNKLVTMAGGKPVIGLAWEGGVPETHRNLRNPPLKLFETIDREKYFLVSVQYQGPFTNNSAEVAKSLGAFHDSRAIEDLDEQAALISSLDCLVTVAQTAMHFAGATNTPTLALIPSKPRWDCIGETESQMPWWKSVKCIRQKDDDWADVFVRLNQELEKRYVPRVLEAAE